MSVPHDRVFFTDRDLGKQFPSILRQAGVLVEKHADHFADNAKDVDWLSLVGRRGWYVLTHNRRIRYTPNEIAAVRQFEIGLLVIIGKAPLRQLAQNFVFTLPSVLRFLEKHSRPFVAKVYRPVQVTKALFRDSKTAERDRSNIPGEPQSRLRDSIQWSVVLITLQTTIRIQMGYLGV